MQDVKYTKYPRTYHFPWSHGTSDDKILTLSDLEVYKDQIVVVTEKMDGESTSMYPDYIHARSLDSKGHESRNWVKALQAELSWEIPEGWRICGENMYAKHTIYYQHLPSYFLVYSIWDENNMCLSWERTLEFCHTVGLEVVPIIGYMKWNENIIKEYNNRITSVYGDTCEGYVVRNIDGFHFNDFKHNVAKFVRKEFANNIGEDHWMYKKVEKNGLIHDETNCL